MQRSYNRTEHFRSQTKRHRQQKLVS